MIVVSTIERRQGRHLSAAFLSENLKIRETAGRSRQADMHGGHLLSSLALTCSGSSAAGGRVTAILGHFCAFCAMRNDGMNEKVAM